MVVRPRVDGDLDDCVAVAHAVHELDGYPPYLPTDLRTFLVSPGAYAAWVAERAGRIVGHVALHRSSVAAAMARASEALDLPADRLGVVARLLVAPTARRGGVGRALLEVATQAAMARGLWPVLDVAVQLPGAVGLYEACGWTPAGRVTVSLGDGFSLDELVFLGPPPPTDDRHRPGPQAASVADRPRR